MIPSLLLLSSLAVAGVPAADPAPAAGPILSWTAPTTFVTGLSYEVRIDVEAPEGGTVVASWLFSPAAFTVDGKPLAKREDRGTLELPAGFKISGTIDLAPHLEAKKSFKLGFATDLSDGEPIEVALLELAPEGLDFMAMPIEQLADYNIMLRTNRGDILVKVWPDVAPNHARNFLDLAYTKFYDETTFHRVIPGFMIQGGGMDVKMNEKPTGAPVRNEARNGLSNTRGSVALARTNAPHSATSQFFVNVRDNIKLDFGISPDGWGYTVVGEVLSGMDVVDAIVAVPTTSRAPHQNVPVKPVVITKVRVISEPAPTPPAATKTSAPAAGKPGARPVAPKAKATPTPGE